MDEIGRAVDAPAGEDVGVGAGAGAGTPAALILVLTNVADAAAARRIAQALMAERLAACVNVLAPCQSIYRWRGAIEQADEVPLLIKTTSQAFDALERRLRALHPYEVPEIVAWQPSRVAPDYLAWAVGETVAEAPPAMSAGTPAATPGTPAATVADESDQDSRSQRAASSAK